MNKNTLPILYLNEYWLIDFVLLGRALNFVFIKIVGVIRRKMMQLNTYIGELILNSPAFKIIFRCDYIYSSFIHMQTIKFFLFLFNLLYHKEVFSTALRSSIKKVFDESDAKIN